MALFDNNFLTVMRNGMQDYATTLDGVNLQVADAQNDVSKQLSQIQNFAAQGVDAIIVNPVDTDATSAMTRIATEADIPLVYVNWMPADQNNLPPNVAFVGPDQLLAGNLQMEALAKCMGGSGNVAIMLPKFGRNVTEQRSEGRKDILDNNPRIKIIAEQVAGNRDEAAKLMTQWLNSGNTGIKRSEDY